MNEFKVYLRPFSVVRALSLIIGVLLLMHLVNILAWHSNIIPKSFYMVKFDLDKEGNVPTFFTAMILFISSFLLLCITYLEKYLKSKFIFQWTLLSVGFFLMGLDEIVTWHEKLGPLFRSIFGNNLGFLHFAWVIAAIPLIIVLGIYYWKFLGVLNRRFKHIFILAGSIYVLGAVVMELIGGYIFEQKELLERTWLPYIISTTIEESLEMVGIAIFIYGLLSYLFDEDRTFILFTNKPQKDLSKV